MHPFRQANLKFDTQNQKAIITFVLTIIAKEPI
jgi:hypothetical protein